VAAGKWNALSEDVSPFHEHAFLSALEATGCVGDDSGWTPLVFGLEGSNGALSAIMPTYLKDHSMGEFVYDWAFADAAQRARVPYYPKMVVTSPFSPIAGPRVLLEPGAETSDRRHQIRHLLEAAMEEAQSRGCQSVHLLFCTEEEMEIARELGFFERLAVQLHWENNGYACFDDYLARFRAKRRKEIKRELSHIAQAGVEIQNLSGAPGRDGLSPDLAKAAFGFYADTVSRFHWGRRYLNEAFFEALFATLPERIEFTVARRGGELIAGAFNLEKNGRRYGRYWGTHAPLPFLHFAVCAYGPIGDCIARGVGAFEAGAGPDGHKFERGFLPRVTRSAHLYFHDDFHRSVEVYCEREAGHVRREVKSLAQGVFIR
jgi:predicted N-acyltransferase